MKDGINEREGMEFYLNSNKDVNSNFILVPLDVIRPSEYDGFSLEEETNLRLFGCELIQEGGIMLKLPQVTMVTGMELFHRFFFRRSFAKTDLQSSVAACLFLATKLEETPKKIRDVVSVFDYLLKIKRKILPPIPVLDLNSIEFLRIRQEITDTERLVLKEVGFTLTHLAIKPYKYLYYYLKPLKLNRLFAQKAWNYINDAYRIPVCVSFPPHVLATTAIYLASHALNVPLPDLDWWTAFGCKLSDIEEVAAEILTLYQMKKVTLDYVDTTIRKYVVEDDKDATMNEAIPETNGEKKIPIDGNKGANKEQARGSRNDKNKHKRSRSRSRHRHRSRSPHRNDRRHKRHRSHDRRESSHRNSSRRSRDDRKDEKKVMEDRDDLSDGSN